MNGSVITWWHLHKSYQYRAVCDTSDEKCVYSFGLKIEKHNWTSSLAGSGGHLVYNRIRKWKCPVAQKETLPAPLSRGHEQVCYSKLVGFFCPVSVFKYQQLYLFLQWTKFFFYYSFACYFFINKAFTAAQRTTRVTLQMSEALSLDQLEELARLIIRWKYNSGTFQAVK